VIGQENVTVTLLSRKLQLTYTLHVTLCLLGQCILQP